MLLDEAVINAKDACAHFQSVPYYPSEAILKEELKTLFDAVANVLVAAQLMTTIGKDQKIAMELYRGHQDVDEKLRKVVKLSLTADGVLFEEMSMTCHDGCHVYGVNYQIVDIDMLLAAKLPPKLIAENIARFLEAPFDGLPGFVGGLKN